MADEIKAHSSHRDDVEAASVPEKGVTDMKQTAADGHIERGLKSRHIQLIALGGTIGTGLFIGSGGALAQTGPAPLFMSYLIMSFFIWILTMDLAEMAAYMPIRGMTIPYLVQRFVEPSLSFAVGWNYWFAYSMIPPAEATASAVIMTYWVEDVNPAVWITMVIVVCVLLNLIAVKYYGESEFWFASIKIIAILGFILVGIVIFFGGAPTHDRLGFRYWQNPGAFNPYLVGGNTGKFLAVWYAVIKSGFSYILSPEIIANTAGECQAPRRNIPKAARRYIWRILLFYVLGTLIIGVIVPYTDKQLLGVSNASASPFVLGIKHAAIPALDHILNAVALTSAWSAGNSQLYSASRMLYGMACTGKAPAIFRRCNRWGVPYLAVLASSVLSLLAYLVLSDNGATVFNWLTTLIVVSGIINWVIVLVTFLRFRAACEFRGIATSMPLRSPWQPYTTYATILFFGLLALTNGFTVFVKGHWDTATFITAYISFPLFVVLYFGHRFWTRSSYWYKSIEEIDLFRGLDEVDAETINDVPPVPRNFLEKLWYWIC